MAGGSNKTHELLGELRPLGLAASGDCWPHQVSPPSRRDPRAGRAREDLSGHVQDTWRVALPGQAGG